MVGSLHPNVIGKIADSRAVDGASSSYWGKSLVIRPERSLPFYLFCLAIVGTLFMYSLTVSMPANHTMPARSERIPVAVQASMLYPTLRQTPVPASMQSRTQHPQAESRANTHATPSAGTQANGVLDAGTIAKKYSCGGHVGVAPFLDKAQQAV